MRVLFAGEELAELVDALHPILHGEDVDVEGVDPGGRIDDQPFAIVSLVDGDDTGRLRGL